MFNYLDCKHLEAAKFCNETITHNRNGLKKKKELYWWWCLNERWMKVKAGYTNLIVF